MAEQDKRYQVDPRDAFDRLIDDPTYFIKNGNPLYTDDLIRLFHRGTEVIARSRSIDTVVYGRDKSDPNKYPVTIENFNALLTKFRMPLIFSESQKTHSYLPSTGLEYDKDAFYYQNPLEVANAATSEESLYGLSRELNFGIVGVGDYTESLPIHSLISSYNSKGQLIPPWQINAQEPTLEDGLDYLVEDKTEDTGKTEDGVLLANAQTLSQALMGSFSETTINRWLDLLDNVEPHRFDQHTFVGERLGENLGHYLRESPGGETSQSARREALFEPLNINTPWGTYSNGSLDFRKLDQTDIYPFSGRFFGTQTPLNRLRIRFEALYGDIQYLRARVSPLIIITDKDFSRYLSRSGVQKAIPSMGIVIEGD